MEKKFIIGIELPELLALFESSVQKIVQKELQAISLAKNQEKEYLTREEVCSEYGITNSTLHRHVNNGVIECFKMGRRSLFKDSQIKSVLIKLNVEGGKI